MSTIIREWVVVAIIFNSVISIMVKEHAFNMILNNFSTIFITKQTLCLVYGRKGRLGFMANTLTFTSLILRMTGDLRGVAGGMVS